ncbi:hypothetical protein HPB48_003702 [Haemaphysalis longicornis]|uniref:Uncharacterized protein n=1 Tax=Haemaphysalis longicornis TaxID=44386 RepID=A0A9J6FHR1_HAELO|nr:hypothetical protein HPB48_003702 [Haemaphysalis longicornis]
MTQTDGDLGKGSCKIFLSVTLNGTASTQVSHVGSEDCATQVDLIPKPTVVCGDEERSCVFTGYRYLNERKDSFTLLCGVGANAFALLLSLLAPLVVRSTDAPIPQKLVIFLMKMKLGSCLCQHRCVIRHPQDNCESDILLHIKQLAEGHGEVDT